MLRPTALLLRVLMLCLGSGSAFAQGSISQFADFNTGPNNGTTGSLGASAVFFDTRTFFIANTRAEGMELWVTDGTAVNTRLFADICPGQCSSSPSAFYIEGSNLFFAADDGRRGNELWRLATGATAPVLVADINPGAPGSDPAGFARLTFVPNGSAVSRTFFAATRLSEGRELWRLNATATPSVALEFDAAAGTASSLPIGFTVFNTLQVGFISRTAGAGREVYALNYTSSSAAAASASVLTGFGTTTQRQANSMLNLGSNTFVLLSDSTTGNDELWVTQGTGASTIKLRTADFIGDLTANSSLFRLFFSSGSFQSRLLAISDGTLVGTTNLTTTTVNPRALVSVADHLLFTGVGGASTGRDLFRSDGTTAGTVFLKELVSGNVGIPDNAVAARTASANRMLLGFSDQLWISDATSGGTSEISGSAIQGAGVLNQVLPTNATNAVIGFVPDFASSSEPFFTGGTSASTVALGNLIADVGDSFPTPLGAINDRLVVAAYIPGESVNAFALPVAAAGAPQGLGDIYDIGSGIHFGKLWFRGFNFVMSDGTPAGTSEIADVLPEIQGPECVIERLGAAYFLASGASSNDVEVYRSDGTAANTFPVTNFSTPDGREIMGYCFPGIRAIAGFGDKLFFVGDALVGLGLELYVLNGNDQVSLVADIRAGSGSSGVLDMVALDDRIVFKADDGIFGSEPWVSNGTAQGTQRLSDISVGAAASEPADFTRVGDLVYFTALEPATGRELYVTDGSAVGTRRVRDLFVGSGSAFSGHRILAKSASHVYFKAISSTEPACVLFESDGSVAGTRCAYDSAAITLGPVQYAVVSAGGALVFTARRFAPDDGEEVRVLFNRQMFSVAGHDIAPGSASSAPQDLMAVGSTVFFRASDGVTGFELWRLDLPDLDALFSDGFE